MKKIPRIIKCPECGKSTEYSDKNPFRPFCSERCKTKDTASWASESYRIKGPPANPEELAQNGDQDNG